MRTQAPLTPLRLYGGSPEIFRRASTGTDYTGTREYVPGDEYHRIEWKATARLRTLMVKEFHPETHAMLQILIDAGRTMHQESYVGTRLDEALAVAQLLVESAVGSGTRVGISVYNETEIVRTIKPAIAEDQLVSLRELALALRAQAGSEKPATYVPSPQPSGRPKLPAGERLGSGGTMVARFVRLLRLQLGLAHPKTGVHKAARTSFGQFLIVLTDLQANNDALLEAASTQREQGRTIVAQINAAWRLSSSLEDAYAEYRSNSRNLQRLRKLGLVVFDVRPERLVENIARHVGKGISTATQ